MEGENSYAVERPVLEESQRITEEQNEAETRHLEERSAEPEGVGGEGQDQTLSEAMYDPLIQSFMTTDEQGRIVEAGQQEGEVIIDQPDEESQI